MGSFLTKYKFKNNLFGREAIEAFLQDENIRYVVIEHLGEINFSSPFTKDKGRRGYINFHKGKWKDFLLDEGGTFITFVKKLKGFETLSITKRYLVENYFDGNLPDLVNEEEDVEELRGNSSIELPDGCEPLNVDKESHQPYIDYLKSRELNHIIGEIEMFVDDADQRIVFPFYKNGELVFWTGRSIDSKAYLRWKNAKEADRFDLIYNIDKINDGSVVYIFEGILDALMVYPRGIALMGRSITEDQIDLILGKNPSKIIVVMDGDEYGKESQRQIADRILDKFYNVYIFDWSIIEGAKDFNDMGYKLAQEAKDHYLHWGNKTLAMLLMKEKIS